MKYQKMWLAALIVILLAGFSLAMIRGGATVSPASMQIDGVVRLGHEPGGLDFGKYPNGPFVATPNFYYFNACGRPCWLPLYPTPDLVEGDAVTDGFPSERLDTPGMSSTGDMLVVVCQVHGEMLHDDLRGEDGHSSDIWNLLQVPVEKVVRGEDQLKRSDGGEYYYAYGADIWMGNTGWHDIPCQK